MHESMVAISRHYPIGADKALQIRGAVFLDKRTQPESSTKKGEMASLIRLMLDSLGSNFPKNSILPYVIFTNKQKMGHDFVYIYNGHRI